MPSGRVPDPAELADDLAEIKAAVERGARETSDAIRRLSERIETTYIRRDVYEARHAILQEKVTKVEERHTWVGRTALAALFLPILVSIVAAIVLGGLR